MKSTESEDLVSASIKRICDQKGVSISDLAQKIGMSFSGLYAALRNNRLKVSNLIDIAETLEVDISDLFVESNTKLGQKLAVYTERDYLEKEKVYLKLNELFKSLYKTLSNFHLSLDDQDVDRLYNCKKYDEFEKELLVILFKGLFTINDYDGDHKESLKYLNLLAKIQDRSKGRTK